MKKILINISSVAYIFLAWCFPVFMLRDWVLSAFMITYGTSILILHSAKNKYFYRCIIACFAVLSLFAFYDIRFLHFIINPYFIITEYISVFKNSSDKNQKEKFFYGINASVIFGAISLIYTYIKTQHITSYLRYNVSFFAVILLFVVFFIVFVLSFNDIRKSEAVKKTGIDTYKLKELKSIYAANIICFIENILCCYLTNSLNDEFLDRAYFLPWFVYFGLILYYKDPSVDVLIKKFRMIKGKFFDI